MASKIYKKGAYIVIVDTVTGVQQEFNSADIQIRKSVSAVDRYEVLHNGFNILDLFLTDAQDENGSAYNEAAFDVFRFEQTGSQNSSEVANPYPAYTETIVNISSAQILAMGTTPIELLPAAGVGNYYDIDKIVIESTYGTVNYVFAGTDYLSFKYGGSSYKDYTISLLNDFYFCSAVIKEFSPWDYVAAITAFNSPLIDVDNNPRLLLTTLSGNDTLSLGDGTLRVKIYHKTITFGA